jgi:hypothetical protein
LSADRSAADSFPRAAGALRAAADVLRIDIDYLVRDPTGFGGRQISTLRTNCLSRIGGPASQYHPWEGLPVWTRDDRH